MALVKKQNMCVLDVADITLTDKDTGKPVPKVKYTFIDQNQMIVVGYRDEHNENYDRAVFNSDKYNDEFAVEVEWKGRLWQNETKWSLV